MNIFMSHDWPRGIYNHGNAKKLLQQKHHFTTEVQTNKLGSRAAEDILNKLKPNYWFSGHLHVKFSALMKHEDTTEGKRSSTKFLALDKCLPRREFLQILEVPSSSPGPIELSHDAEWLTILRLTNHLLSTNSRIVYMPGPGSKERYDFTPTPEEIKETVSKMGGDLRIPVSDFVRTAESFSGPDGVLPDMSFVSMPEPLSNPQTTNLCSKLGLTDPLRRSEASLSASCLSELDLEAEFPEEVSNKSPVNTTLSSLQLTADSFNSSCNPAEIDLSDEEEVEISKDEETGDFIMELPLSSSSFNSSCKSSPKRISPFRASLASTPKGQTTISPFSSPKSADEDFPSKRLSLSKPKERTSPPPSGDESEEMGERSLLSRKDSTASSSSSSFLPLSTSSQSEGESGSESGGGLKRGGIATPVKTTKKLKRRNVA
ncbi:UNVERIFIED_CONTAM: hypothetical protein GTU68_015538, partial [Idotea baltica]|nr:hypothetical protein [Idotea baltica]MCL4141037.1 hypothetical protein [Idotea baltica]